MLSISDYERSLHLLQQAATPTGFTAAVHEHDNYKRVWTRDGVITSLAALASQDPALIQTAKATLQTLFDHQHPVGFMPSNVTPGTNAVSYGGTVGRADNPSWAVIGLLFYTLHTEDTTLADQYQPQVQKCLAVLEAWEFNGKGLIYVPQSGDWADEYIQHGYILYDQLLRLWALELAAAYYHDQAYREKAQQIRSLLQVNFWYSERTTGLYAANMVHQMPLVQKPYWLLGFNPARIYPQFDLQANALALLLGLGTPDQKVTLINFIRSSLQSQQDLLASFSPAIEEDTFFMEELRHNHAYGFRNFPHEFHNGGLWPVWNGFLVAGLMACQEVELAQQVTEYIHRANHKHTSAASFGFYENLHGLSKDPIGVPLCTWSAAGAVIAELSLSGFSFSLI
ncbi:hypothetical protein BWI96_02330 [Siphonobacter sp. SORGH_AS_0500]|uniref:glycoside hydrolase 100 family protein n=1 Tax=Siphonobacter sp. SORGH_AS_0500 TaxID=1864824 RepID=UPI000CB636AD|nr:glycoside hydrolase 100 family protein [Siphonobacter sp. SORGH_AS_0500]PKK37948.1 hypothetical protein BWI96_02330 [Siphonobacter sp. SORGH_AS_0500]